MAVESKPDWLAPTAMVTTPSRLRRLSSVGSEMDWVMTITPEDKHLGVDLLNYPKDDAA
ncbi:MAG: hypothetical protein ACTHKR_10680 [Sphingomonas sp.]